MDPTVAPRFPQRGGTGVGGLVLVNGPPRFMRTSDFPSAVPIERFERYVDDLAARWYVEGRLFVAE